MTDYTMKSYRDTFIKQKAKVTFLFLCVLFFASQTVAQDLTENNPNADFGLVYFMRGKGHAGSAYAFSALIDEVRVCKLNNRRYSVHQVPPGEHQFSAQFGGKKGKEKAEILIVEIEAGKTYYMQMFVQTSFWYSDLALQEVTRNTALSILKDDKLKLDPYCGETEFDF